MGFIDSIKEALGGDRDDDGSAASARSSSTPRHIDHNAPAEAPVEAEVVTGGKHAARD